MEAVSTDQFLVRLAISVLAYFLFNVLIQKAVKNADAKNIFEWILILACVLYVLLGQFLPF